MHDLRRRAQPDLQLAPLKHLGIHSALELTAVEQDAVAVGKSATTLTRRQPTGAVQIAVIRAGEPHYQRETDFLYAVGETPVPVGDRDALDRAAEWCRRH
ncbi:MAG: hypothetical protein VYE68_00020 [Acidobacteriota bacterium]|nr:hypothetical protein [Acidobacteriota bacterium]